VSPVPVSGSGLPGAGAHRAGARAAGLPVCATGRAPARRRCGGALRRPRRGGRRCGGRARAAPGSRHRQGVLSCRGVVCCGGVSNDDSERDNVLAYATSMLPWLGVRVGLAWCVVAGGSAGSLVFWTEPQTSTAGSAARPRALEQPRAIGAGPHAAGAQAGGTCRAGRRLGGLEQGRRARRQVREVLPGYGAGFVGACLDACGGDAERVVHQLLEGSLPAELAALDPHMPAVPAPAANGAAGARGEGGAGGPAAGARGCSAGWPLGGRVAGLSWLVRSDLRLHMPAVMVGAGRSAPQCRAPGLCAVVLQAGAACRPGFANCLASTALLPACLCCNCRDGGACAPGRQALTARAACPGATSTPAARRPGPPLPRPPRPSRG